MVLLLCITSHLNLVIRKDTITHYGIDKVYYSNHDIKSTLYTHNINISLYEYRGMNEVIDEFDQIYKPKTIGELLLITRMITDKKRYLLIENKQEQPILVDVREATAFNIGVDLITDRQYNRLSEYFETHGAISTINRLANNVWDKTRDM